MTSTNPVVQSIISGNAPPAARSAAARGLLPLPQADLLEALVHLTADNDPAIAQAAQETLASQPPADLLQVASTETTAPAVLGYLASLGSAGNDIHEAIAANPNTPDEAIALLAGATPNTSLIELITLNQQRLIRAPEIIDAVLLNPARSAEAERRAKETHREFFEKERGARQIAQELRARINLHLRLRSQTHELRKALQRLKQAESSLVQSEKMVALGRMVAGVAHEMNNPLHFLRGNVALLKKRMPAEGPLGPLAPLFEDIEESMERMTSVTRQLLLFGRKQEDQGTGTVKLSDVISLVVKMVAPQTPKGVRIVQQVNGAEVKANPQDLFQIVLNIVHNAVQAVDPQNGEVRIAAAQAGDRVEIRVADNGCGISAENLSRIFDPFFTTKPPGSGTGLGLSIVQELVTAQSGTVRVESEVGRGTTVAVSLQGGLA